jgi:hypothetical protein
MLVALALTATPASANQLVETFNFSLTLPTSSGESFTLPTFDTLGGARSLISVSLDFTGTITFDAVLDNTGSSNETWGVQANGYAIGNISPHLAGTDNYLVTFPTQSVAPGILDLGLLSFPVSSTHYIAIPEAFDYADAGFYGGGLMPGNVTGLNLLSLYGGPGMGHVQLSVNGPTTLAGTMTVTFDYTPVPEPSACALASLAMAGLVLLRMQRSR